MHSQVDAISEALMPSGVRGLRSMFHATAVEVLLYLTPVHCQDMLDSLTTSLNATFTSFMKRNPAFKVCPPSTVQEPALGDSMLSGVFVWQWCGHGQLWLLSGSSMLTLSHLTLTPCAPLFFLSRTIWGFRTMLYTA